MKIYVSMETLELLPLKHHLVLEGSTLVNNQENPELTISESQRVVHDKTVIYSHVKFPHAILKALELNVVFSQCKYFFTKWYDYEKGWGKQVFLGIPIWGIMDGNLGKCEATGVCGRYVKNDQCPDIFLSDKLQTFLNDLRCRSFVSVEFSADNEISGIQTGVPYGGLYNLLEGVKGSILEFLLNPFENRLIESWTSNVLLTRYPWPFGEVADKISIHGVTPEVEAHVWFYEVERFRRSIVSKSSTIARITAWGWELRESNKRVLRTAFDLRVPFKQFRLDCSRQAGEVYESLLNSGIV
ncbi:hypothetical protein LCGC14_0848780 [marine sediment metagenome]|uniref:Uncharacterized protein n=1 Tax=marine sediment metagenome TaxID=412755 RepID=A0A0F9RVR1_9ZZZZ